MLASFSKYTFESASMILAAASTWSVVNPRRYAKSRAWNGSNPVSGLTGTFRIFSGEWCATSSMSIPPSALAISTGRPIARSSTMPR